MKKLALTLSFTLAHLGTTAWAHDGHGLGGTHWHATDALGFVGVVALAALGWWLSRK
jgi:Co/Zn/Cd efflux system component